MAVSRADVLKYLEDANMMEISGLVDEIKEKFGVEIAAPVAMAAAAPGAGDGAAAEEQTEFNLVLVGIGDKKIQVIKTVREITSLGLKEAKDLVEGVPSNVKEGINKDEAEKLKAKFEEVGATVEIK